MTLPLIPTLPDPPQRGTDVNDDYSDKMDAHIAALHPWTDAANALALALAEIASTSNYTGVSTTPVAIGTGVKVLVTQNAKRYAGGTDIKISSAANLDNCMWGRVIDYDVETGDLDFECTRIGPGAAGTHADWIITLSGPQGEGGDVLPAFAGNAFKVLTPNAAETAAEWDFSHYYIRQAADRLLAYTAATQKLFDATTNGALTLPVGVYAIEMAISLEGQLTTVGSPTFDILGAGNATLGEIHLTGIGKRAAENQAAAAFEAQVVNTATIIPTANAGAADTVVLIRGQFKVTGAGTIIPSVALGVTNQGNLMAGSYYTITPLGAGNTGGSWS